MIKKLLNVNYHPQLISMMTKSTFIGALSANILTPILLAIVLFEDISHAYIFIWIVLNFIIALLRIIATKRIAIANVKEDKSANKILYYMLIIILLTASLHSYALWYSSPLVSDIQLFFMAFIIVAMVSGAISTIGSVFNIFALYVVLSILAIVIVFINHGGTVFYAFAFAMFVYMFVMLKSGYRQYFSLKENIILKETFQSRVKESTIKLEKQNKRLNESLHNFQDLLDTSMVMIAFHRDGIMVDMNQSAIRKFEYTNQSEVVGKHISEFLPKKSIPIVQEAMKKDYTKPYELIMKKKDGSEFPAIVSAKYTILNGEKVRMTTMMDLTEIKKNEKLLYHQSKLAQMGEMISMIAHQWRQPLAAISATSIALNLKAKLNKVDSQTVQDMTNQISNYSKHLSQTIDDFREFFKANKEKRDTDFSELVNSVLNIVELSIANQNITIKRELKSKEKFSSYPNELKQVILNLIKNAEDILIEREIENPYIMITTYEDGDSLILEVSDNGGGVADNIIDEIFNPYFSTKKLKDGTGLGLYMSKTIIENHCHGVLTVCNADDGAVFRIALTKNGEEE